jgi:hypothetical protein
MHYDQNSPFRLEHHVLYRLTLLFAASLSMGFLSGCSTMPEKPDEVQRFTLSWNSSPEPVQGYQVFKGTTPEAEQMIKVREIAPQAGNQQTLSLTYAELGVAQGQQVCFRVKAFTSDKVSSFSEAICTTR